MKSGPPCEISPPELGTSKVNSSKFYTEGVGCLDSMLCVHYMFFFGFFVRRRVIYSGCICFFLIFRCMTMFVGNFCHGNVSMSGKKNTSLKNP